MSKARPYTRKRSAAGRRETAGPVRQNAGGYGNATYLQPDPEPALTAEQKEQMEQEYRKKLAGALAVMKERYAHRAQYSRAEALDNAINRAYWKNGGIRFFAEQLRRRLTDLRPDATPEEMSVDLFNSAILPVRSWLEGFRRKQEEGEDAPIPSDDELLEELRGMDLDEYIQENAGEPEPYVSRCTALLQRIEELFEGEDASALAPDAGADQAACHACAERLLRGIEALLEDYPLPL